ncbi:MAG: hypothetical protein ACRENE_21020 [Polyangiaceae bacterium]
MSPYSLWWAAIASSLVAQSSIVGCSSSSSGGSPGAADDAAADGGGAEASSTAEGGNVTDGGGISDAPVSCEASTLPPADAGGACNACLKTGCATELAACAADCVCGPIVACLQLSSLNNYPGCNGLGAIESNETQLMNFAACAADPGKCGGPCFGNEAGAD